MGFDPLDSGDYHKFESTSGSDSSGRNSPPPSNRSGGKRFSGQEIVGIGILVVLALCGVAVMVNILSYL